MKQLSYKNGYYWGLYITNIDSINRHSDTSFKKRQRLLQRWIQEFWGGVFDFVGDVKHVKVIRETNKQTNQYNAVLKRKNKAGGFGQTEN